MCVCVCALQSICTFRNRVKASLRVCAFLPESILHFWNWYLEGGRYWNSFKSLCSARLPSCTELKKRWGETERCAWTPGVQCSIDVDSKKCWTHPPSEKPSLSSFCWDSTCWWGAAAPAGFCSQPSPPLLMQDCSFWGINVRRVSASHNLNFTP